MGIAGPSFHDSFVGLFEIHFRRLFRYLDRLSGEPELADIAQETFVRLYRPGSLPDTPSAWLISVAMNLFRNAQSSRSRHRRLLTAARGEGLHGDPPSSPDEAAIAEESRHRVRLASIASRSGSGVSSCLCGRATDTAISRPRSN